MNCPKCNAVLNEGDKFCPVCGATIDGGVVQNNQPAPEAVMPTPPVNPVPQPVNQPMPQPVAQGPAPVGGMGPQPVKKNNTIVYVLIAIIVVLVVAVAFLALNGNKEESTKTDDKEQTETGTTTPKPEEVAVSKYNETSLNGLKFKLPEGYGVEDYDLEGTKAALLYGPNDETVAAVAAFKNVSINNVSTENLKVTLKGSGFTDVEDGTTTINGKKVIYVIGTYTDYTIEYLYVAASPTTVVYACIAYDEFNPTNQTAFRDIISNVTVESTSFSSTTNPDALSKVTLGPSVFKSN